jgi:hypothetical protein
MPDGMVAAGFFDPTDFDAEPKCVFLVERDV